jgi:hypothetical protein
MAIFVINDDNRCFENFPPIEPCFLFLEKSENDPEWIREII